MEKVYAVICNHEISGDGPPEAIFRDRDEALEFANSLPYDDWSGYNVMEYELR